MESKGSCMQGSSSYILSKNTPSLFLNNLKFLAQKILLCLCVFLCGVIEAEDLERKWFVGFDGGVGLYDLGLSMVITPNLRLYGEKPYAGEMNYLLGIIGGFQKYTYEKVGFRFSFGIKGYYVEKFGNVSYDDSNIANKTYHSLGDGGGFYAVIYYDGLFDFVHSGDNRFGMILGIGVEQGMLFFNRPNKTERAFGFMGNFPIRLGFQTQLGHNIIDLVANLSLGGISLGGLIGEGFDVGSYNSTLTLGYKYLF